jgi:hypothetical protein
MPEGEPQQQPSDTGALTFEKFGGLQTATTRPGVPDEQAYWLDGFMPLAPRDLRTLYGTGAAKYTVPGGTTLVDFGFYNLGATPYAVVFRSDGAAIQINTSTGATVTILPAATIAIPSILNIGISQWGSQYLIIVANQTNGYWLWDGALLYTAGTLAPQVTLTNVGNAYQSVPVVTATGGNGHGASFVASIGGGVVTNVIMTNPGTGYLPGDVATLVFTGGTLAGTSGALTAVLTHAAGGSGGALAGIFTLFTSVGVYDLYQCTGITLTTPGTGYDVNVTAGFNAAPANSGWGNNVGSSDLGPPGLVVTQSGGVINSATRAADPGNPNYYYWTLRASPLFPTITVIDTGSYFVSSVTIGNGGSNYSPATTITVSAGGNPQSQAVITPTIAGGVITGTTIKSGGVYGSNTPPTLVVVDTATTAAGTVTLMPFGVSGTAVETYQGHVWVFNGNNFNFTAPGSVSNFATSAGGGSQQTNNSYTKIGYSQAISTNGFLFLIGDSSMDYISGVVTNTPQGGNPTTTFTQNNSDPEVGTPYPAAVTTLGSDILVANSAGIFVSSGGTFQKKSEALDGVYNSVANFNNVQLSAAKATIFGKRVWMVLVTIIDPLTLVQATKLLMFNGRVWWTSTQNLALTFICGQEINSVYTAWGTDGNALYPLFQTPTTAFTKTAVTKLWDEPGGYESTKADSRFWSLWQAYSVTGTTQIDLYVDAVGIDGTGARFTNQQHYAIAGPTGTGFFVTPPQAIGQQGVLTGFTLLTSAADMALISAKVEVEDVGFRG